LNAYARGIRSGKRVRQGQIIGYVGSTGMATGPHLHYEFRVNGSHRNPLTVKLPRAIPLKGEEKQRFLAQTNNLRQQLLAFASQRTLAMNEF
jgi:murein DD-endopeptidase MepM/ murein hydrolase activator NlpD